MRSIKKKYNKGSSKRKIRNFLLLPNYQIKLGVYTICLAVSFFMLISVAIYLKLGEIVTLIVQLTDIEEEVKEVLVNYVSDLSWWGLFTIFLYIFANFSLSIIYTHKMIGPSVSLKNHIIRLREHDYKAKTHLRRGDAFKDIAEELNLLSDTLDKKNKSKNSRHV